MKRRRWGLAALAAGMLLLGLAVAQESTGELRDEPRSDENLAEPATLAPAAAPATVVPPAETPPPATLAPPVLGPLQITIFRDGRALVRRRQTFTLSVGQNSLALADVATRLDPTTVRFRPVEPRAGLTVLEQTSLAGATSSRELIAAAVGKPVRVRDGRFSVDGTLLAVEDDGVIVASQQEVHVHPAGEIILPRGAELPALTPSLSWLVEAAEAGPIECEVSYLTEGLSWAADYALTVGDDDRLVSFEAWVRVVNESGVAYPAAALVFSPGSSGTGETASPSSTRYFLPRPADLPAAAAKRLSLVQLAAVRSAVRHVVTLSPTGVADLRLMAELTNSAASGLGLALPPGPVRLYAPDRFGRPDLVGQQRLPATATDAPLRFDLGPAEGLEASVRNTPADGATARTVTLRNLRTEDVTVRVVEQRPGSWQVVGASSAFTAPVAQRASAEVTVPANGTATLTYQIRVSPTPEIAPAGSAT